MRRIAPIGVVLCLQAFLLLYQLDLLAVWDDELSTYGAVARPVGQIITGLQRDVHPPLYFVLLHGWAQLRLPWQGIAALRAFSALWALVRIPAKPITIPI
jgi:mannosyltransferase